MDRQIDLICSWLAIELLVFSDPGETRKSFGSPVFKTFSWNPNNDVLAWHYWSAWYEFWRLLGVFLFWIWE